METENKPVHTIEQNPSDARHLETTNSPQRTPSKWWQWVLMYPALALALLGHAPTVSKLVQSYKINIPFGEVESAIHQNELWANNIECIQGMKFYKATTYCNDCISVGVCKSGDILVRVDTPEPRAKPHVKWVSFGDLKQETGQASLLVPDAMAESFEPNLLVTEVGVTVVCKKWLDNGRLLMRLSYPDGHCVDQTVNTFTGAIERIVPAPCSPQC